GRPLPAARPRRGARRRAGGPGGAPAEPRGHLPRADPRGGGVSDRRTVLQLAKMAILVALRTPRAIIFTALFPLILLLLFNSIFIGGSDRVPLPDDVRLSGEAYFTAGIVAYTVALSTFTTLTVSLTTQRENGQLKRYRGTPMPPWAFITAQIVRAGA